MISYQEFQQCLNLFPFPFSWSPCMSLFQKEVSCNLNMAITSPRLLLEGATNTKVTWLLIQRRIEEETPFQKASNKYFLLSGWFKLGHHPVSHPPFTVREPDGGLRQSKPTSITQEIEQLPLKLCSLEVQYYVARRWRVTTLLY